MLERFFIIEETSSFYKDYHKQEEYRAKVSVIIESVFERFGIFDQTSFGFTATCLLVAVYPGFEDAFEDQLLKTPTYENDRRFREFKKSSKIFKAYKTQLKKEGLLDKYVSPVLPSEYLTESIGVSGYRQFKYDGVLYCSILASKTDYRIPEDWKEVKGSEFYEILERMNS